MREMYEKVRNSDSTTVQTELQTSEAGKQRAWITIAAANVLPEVGLHNALNNA